MIGKILSGLFSLVIALINTLLAPIDALIDQFLPAVSDALDAVNSLLDFTVQIVGYVVDASGIADYAIALVVGYWTFVITATFSVYVVKLALKWYRMLMP